jgi:hypothetical protein
LHAAEIQLADARTSAAAADQRAEMLAARVAASDASAAAWEASAARHEASAASLAVELSRAAANAVGELRHTFVVLLHALWTCETGFHCLLLVTLSFGAAT